MTAGLLRELFNRATYRTTGTPGPTEGLWVVRGRFGARTVCDPRVPGYLEARRRRLVRDGLDPVDRVLLDPATVALLRATSARMPRVPA